MADNNSRTARRKTQKRTQKRKQKPKKRSLFKRIVQWLLIIILVGSIIGIGLVAYWISNAPDIDEEQLTVPFSSTIYDRNGEEFADLSGEQQRKQVSYEDLPQVLVDAVTATEDSRFFDHPGVDIRRIGGAVIANITDGFGSEGASTITQQVVERAFLSPDKKISLKVQEMWLAIQLERQYSKEEIMEMYLNGIFYGSNSYGVAQAAETYFGKEDLSELTLPEAAILAGLPQRPTAYNPFESPELTKERMDTVLYLMVRHDKITEAQAEEARQVDIPSLLAEKTQEVMQYEAFIDQVEKEVSMKIEDADLYADGLKVYTTLDPTVQETVESMLTDSDGNPIPYPDEEMQAAVTVLDTDTGEILGIGGRRNNVSAGEFNYAINGATQIGSTAKPIMAYGPAIEYNQMSTYHQINDDAPYPIPGTEEAVRNWNRSYGGWMTARHALAQSLNVPALKVYEEVGRENAQSFAESLGVEFSDDQMTMTDVIGGSSTNVTPLEVAGAYRAFGNEGIYNDAYAVTKVEFPDGDVVEFKPEQEAVMKDYTAYMVTDMLKTAVTDGTGTRANVPGIPVAGKTGTTNLDSGGSPDAWFAGYSTNFTISAWVGGYEDEEGNRAAIPGDGTHVPQHLFREIMTSISEGMETADFKQPSSVVQVGVEEGSNPAALPSDYTPASEIVTELFVKGTEPTRVSEIYDQLNPVTGLTGNYDEVNSSINLSWNHGDSDVSFDVALSVNGGEMQNLTSTEETSYTINDIEEPGTYTIQVTAVSGSTRSEAVTTTVSIEDENEVEDLPGVNGLNASYNAEQQLIDITWGYEGPPASYRVSVNGETQTVDSEGTQVSGVIPGETYAIDVTPVSEGVEGATQSTSITIPEGQEDTGDGENNEETPPGEENEDEPDGNQGGNNNSNNGTGNGNNDSDNGQDNNEGSGNNDSDANDGDSASNSENGNNSNEGNNGNNSNNGNGNGSNNEEESEIQTQSNNNERNNGEQGNEEPEENEN